MQHGGCAQKHDTILIACSCSRQDNIQEQTANSNGKINMFSVTTDNSTYFMRKHNLYHGSNKNQCDPLEVHTTAHCFVPRTTATGDVLIQNHFETCMLSVLNNLR